MRRSLGRRDTGSIDSCLEARGLAPQRMSLTPPHSPTPIRSSATFAVNQRIYRIRREEQTLTSRSEMRISRADAINYFPALRFFLAGLPVAVDKLAPWAYPVLVIVGGALGIALGKPGPHQWIPAAGLVGPMWGLAALSGPGGLFATRCRLPRERWYDGRDA